MKLKEDLNFNEIQKFFKDIPENQSGNIQRSYIYGLACSEQERREKESSIEKNIKGNKMIIINTTIISENIAVVETEERLDGKRERVFRPVVNGCATTEVAFSFDYALIIALATKYNQKKHAPSMIYNMLRMDKNEVE